MTISHSDIQRLRQTSELWQTVPMVTRLRLIRRFRNLLRQKWRVLPELFPNRPAIETITAELLPLLAACKFLEKNAAKTLRARRAGFWGRPVWLPGVTSTIERRPYGTVLILAPGNYPLMLPGIQVLQSIVAGNAVALKPAPGGEAAAKMLSDLVSSAGFPNGLCEILPTDSGSDAVAAGFDLIILTGSARTGRAVLEQASKTLTPTIIELSGVDPVFVLPDANLAHVARKLVYGARLNNGATCIAPHRVFISHQDKTELVDRLRNLLKKKKPLLVDKDQKKRLEAFSATIKASGGRTETIGSVTLLTQMEELHHLLDTDIFAPWIAIIGVADVEEALCFDRQVSYALGASIFGSETSAKLIAPKISAGSICINDLIIPTADPRLPFGGARSSGYGTTRGAEGLLSLTRPIVTSVRKNIF
ncbi:aldehyde dehydrogenase family protein [Gluconobacter cerinus]|uniref:aldehyde dehydrogenase family protein n=1 Tax=Gluconobacter cerinus TaxID=38307 RepID=UPI001B8C03BF|nr:aldehyde dehydrogenase family protein [Gluconobacter cerinus]MBS1040401.1 aldehyde dehydrogenase family protein [Gluconobacter cerinus]MBS1046632.1 aldehyde dehydrogenase family protein [Gluconobacter cerinus]